MIEAHRDVTRLVGQEHLGSIIVLAVGLCVVLPCALAPERHFTRCGTSREDVQKMQVRQLAGEGSLVWKQRNPQRTCPATLAEVAAEVDLRDTRDRWGAELIWFCGADLPAGAKSGLAVLSLGPDGAPGTEDDIKSWE